jgi:hypothetical protein
MIKPEVKEQAEEPVPEAHMAEVYLLLIAGTVRVVV